MSPQHDHELRGWLVRIAHNLAANRWRDAARRTERENRKASPQPDVQEVTTRFELRREIVQAPDSLGQTNRETILMRYFEDLAPRDIAKQLGVPVVTVKKRLQRGLAQLRETLDKRHGGDRAHRQPALIALALPTESAVGGSAMFIGGLAMRTLKTVSTAVLVVTACLFFAFRESSTNSPRVATVDVPANEAGYQAPSGTGHTSAIECRAEETGQRSQVG